MFQFFVELGELVIEFGFGQIGTIGEQCQQNNDRYEDDEEEDDLLLGIDLLEIDVNLAVEYLDVICRPLQFTMLHQQQLGVVLVYNR